LDRTKIELVNFESLKELVLTLPYHSVTQNYYHLIIDVVNFLSFGMLKEYQENPC